jgi:hypothetical protein
MTMAERIKTPVDPSPSASLSPSTMASRAFFSRTKNSYGVAKTASEVAKRVSEQSQQWNVQRRFLMDDVKNPDTRVTSFVTHHTFELCIGIVILLNALFLVVHADWTAQHPGGVVPLAYSLIETLFFVVFGVELGLRLWVFRCRFFTGSDRNWNWFDFVVVVTAAIEETVKLITAATDVKLSNVTLFRAMRIIKLTRVVRIVRVFRSFRELRIMLASIISTFTTLFWSIVCLLMIMSAFAVFFITIVSDYQASDGLNDELQEYFGSVPKVMLSLFQATTGGMDWRDLSNALLKISFWPVAMLCIFISLMNYAILNILTGIVVNTANKTAEDDFEISIHEERSRQDNTTGRLKQLLHEGDKENTGMITWVQLDKHLGSSEIKNLFKKLDLEPWHLQSFFDVLKAGKDDEEAQIDIDQFVRGCMRLRCNVKNIDLIASGREQMEAQSQALSEVQQKLECLCDALGGELHFISDPAQPIS